MRRSLRLLVPTLLMLLSGPAAAETALVAAAANFAEPLQRLTEAFAAETGHRIEVSTGSTGTLAAQIRNGAPFTLFLAADAERPAELEAQGLTVPGTRITYAVGRLVLWSPHPTLLPTDLVAALSDPRLAHLAIANPRLAPYGRAAEEALKALGAWEVAQPKLVRGADVAQAFQFVASGNAELGFVALSQVQDQAGIRWEVPRALYSPIRQQAVLLPPGKDNAAARAFLEFLRSDTAQAIIRAAGYDLDGE